VEFGRFGFGEALVIYRAVALRSTVAVRRLRIRAGPFKTAHRARRMCDTSQDESTGGTERCYEQIARKACGTELIALLRNEEGMKSRFRFSEWAVLSDGPEGLNRTWPDSIAQRTSVLRRRRLIWLISVWSCT
jgi:hypothetical protein